MLQILIVRGDIYFEILLVSLIEVPRKDDVLEEVSLVSGLNVKCSQHISSHDIKTKQL